MLGKFFAITADPLYGVAQLLICHFDTSTWIGRHGHLFITNAAIRAAHVSPLTY
jgi:hypothetical protein